MKWDRPHPSNAGAAAELAEYSPAAPDPLALVAMVIADRLAAIEGGEDYSGDGLDAYKALVKRVEAEAATPMPRRS